MQIFINAVDGAVHQLEVSPDMSIADIKEEFGIPEAVVSLGPKIIEDEDATLEDLEVENLATLNVNARLLGGKVHGSLARAGKVRAQTPKVEKSEKKKKKRGRALRRIQYNRRFVNVAVSGPGRKRGPNSNQPQ
ncbi:CRE-RPS-30 protein [Aphelenchoides avenae]|nr:CRE-RPS-30 protein [Aphelenchus avenae]